MSSLPAFPLLHTHLLLKKLLALNPKTGPARHYIYVVGESTQCMLSLLSHRMNSGRN